jgi:hypothetical protein
MDTADRLRGFKFSHRTENIEVPQLVGLFEAGKIPVFTVRNLELPELARARHARNRLESLQAAVEAVVSAYSKIGKRNALTELLELENDVEGEVAFRLEVLCAGCTSPPFDTESAALLGQSHAGVLWTLTETILKLTGLGDVPGEPLGCGVTAV